VRDRWRARRLSAGDLDNLRRDPFYFYLLARTKHYDQLIVEAVEQGVRRFVGIGVGSDSRAYRFAAMLRRAGVQVLECDQRQAIRAKQRIVKRWQCSDFVRYLEIDLNNEAWPELAAELAAPSKPRTLVMIEGVSPYINAPNFTAFLRMLGGALPAGSTVAYDFKVPGVKGEFGVSERAPQPFRLSCEAEAVLALHRYCGLSLERVESGPMLTRRVLASLRHAATPMWEEDGACIGAVEEHLGS
jgi:methyltransferase (TIGR00027 family)